jgi:hypothetical protein
MKSALLADKQKLDQPDAQVNEGDGDEEQWWQHLDGVWFQREQMVD